MMWQLTCSPQQRLIIGVGMLFLVDVIWVASSEVSRYLFATMHYDKPFFATYLKTAMFSIYLSGFLCVPSWHRLACKKNRVAPNPPSRSHSSESIKIDPSELLSEPMFVPTSPGEESESDFNVKAEEATEADEPLIHTRRMSDVVVTSTQRSVRFAEMSEVREMATSIADEATRARLSYAAAEGLRLEEERAAMLVEGKLPISMVAKLSIIFCLLWFLGNYSYSLALKDTVAGVVNVLSSTSSLFTLILAAVLPSVNTRGDQFTLTKLLCVMMSIGGVAVVSLADTSIEHSSFPLGAMWALVGALCYALYIVLLRRRVDDESQMSLPMFFGFVGLFNSLLLWPGLFVLNAMNVEPFVMPNATEWAMLAANGLIGTVASELLWLWGCFLTSSLLATLSLSLTTPMTMLADFFVFGKTYHWSLYVGSIPVFLSFIFVAILAHFDNPDPVGKVLRRMQRVLLPGIGLTASAPYVPRRNTNRDVNVNTEQTERLLREEEEEEEQEPEEREAKGE